MHAYCYRSGEIGFGETIPKGCLSLIEGDEAAMERVKTRARWKRDGSGDVLVPGLPEAGSEEEAYLALRVFRRFLRGERVDLDDPELRRLNQLKLETLNRDYPARSANG
ncbi:MAG: hypothetical protein NXI21_01875 [Alphaproteobacteria bacterium]|nr:hypothetical protein [Alphaproteobacteria bacterium]